MQPIALDVTRQGDLGGQKVAMSFDENSIAHIMSVLTDLYSDPELAVIREYSTNAMDAHIEAGQTRPIEVTTPSSLSQNFRVKDYGLGLSVDDIENIYSKYGASTKRESNTQVGMLGLGCKSALTYTSQFQIVAVKDGIKTTVSVARIEDGTGVMEIVDLDDTDEPNSVEVIVPTKRYDTFLTKCESFFRFWQPGQVLLNGKPVALIGGDEVGKTSIFLIDGIKTDYIVMGNVAYEVEDGIYQGTRPWQRPFGLVAYVPIGSVAFVPSREALNYNSTTNATITRLRQEFRAAIQANIANEISTAPTYAKAIAAHRLWFDRFGALTQGIQYKGLDIPTRWNMKQPDELFMLWKVNSYRYAVEYNRREVEYTSLVNNLVITNFPSDKLNPTQRSKIRGWMDANTQYSYVYIFPGDIPGRPWTDDCVTVDWSIIKAIKLNTAASTRKSASGLRFSVVSDTGSFTDTDELDTNLDITYFSPADYKNVSGNIPGAMKHLTDDVQVVSLTRNRWDKFVRDFPTAVPLQTWLHNHVKDAHKALTQDDLLAMGIQNYNRDRLIKLDETRIDDPELVKFILAAKAKTSDSKTREAFTKALNTASRAISLRWTIPAIDTPLSRYPLVENALGYKVHKHVYVYLNAAYQEEISAQAIDAESAA